MARSLLAVRVNCIVTFLEELVKIKELHTFWGLLMSSRIVKLHSIKVI